MTGGGLGRGEGFARDALFALELHGVHLRADAILAADLVNLVDATGVEEDALSQSGLATVDVRGDANVSREGVHAGGEGGEGSRDRGRERDRTPVRDGGLSQAQSARQGESVGAGTRSPRRGVEPRRGSTACGPAHRATPCGEVANPAPAAAPHHFRLAPADFPERRSSWRAFWRTRCHLATAASWGRRGTREVIHALCRWTLQRSARSRLHHLDGTRARRPARSSFQARVAPTERCGRFI